MKRYFTYCGLYCGACSSMLLYDKAMGNIELKDFEVDYEETPCAGCMSGVNSDCEFVICNQQHGTESCAFCPEFPCEMIVKFSKDEWPHHIDVIDNLKRIKEIGIEAWLNEQQGEWSCPDCGKRTHWYQDKCLHCGANWVAKYT